MVVFSILLISATTVLMSLTSFLFFPYFRCSHLLFSIHLLSLCVGFFFPLTFAIVLPFFISFSLDGDQADGVFFSPSTSILVKLFFIIKGGACPSLLSRPASLRLKFYLSSQEADGFSFSSQLCVQSHLVFLRSGFLQ